MKAKDYIRILGIKKGWDWTKEDQFLSLFSKDFTDLIAYVKLYDDIVQFNKVIREMWDKWNSISNNVPNRLPNELWKEFYDTVILPSKEKYCPTYTSWIKQTAQREREEEEFKKNLFNEFYTFYNDFYNNNFEDFFNQIPHEITKPNNAFAYFGLSSNATKTDVLSAFHAKILLVHPDKGGTKEEAAECIKMKDLCLNYLNKKL